MRAYNSVGSMRTLPHVQVRAQTQIATQRNGSIIGFFRDKVNCRAAHHNGLGPFQHQLSNPLLMNRTLPAGAALLGALMIAAFAGDHLAGAAEAMVTLLEVTPGGCRACTGKTGCAAGAGDVQEVSGRGQGTKYRRKCKIKLSSMARF